MSVSHKYVSFGAGVQSTTILALVQKGKLERPDALIFADTHWEPTAVYRHLEWCVQEAWSMRLPIYMVSAGDLRADALLSTVRDPKRWASMPLYTINPDGSKGMLNRQCTKEYKIEPINRKIRELMEAKGKRLPPGSVYLWMGISLDEVYRMKLSRDAWRIHKFPLIDLEMRREDCLAYLKSIGWPEPPRSACIGCPFHSDLEWRRIKANPAEWDDAVSFDEAIRSRGNVRGKLYLHRSCVPLKDADLREREGQYSLWNGECEGMCGV